MNRSTSKSLTLFSPAKINLFLRIMGKRPDGYHELASLFQAIGLGDTLTFTLTPQDSLTCSDPSLPCNDSNLIIKALHLFRRKTNLHIPVTIHLEKHIPTQAGLGGGSSNAATTLGALNTLTTILTQFKSFKTGLRKWAQISRSFFRMALPTVQDGVSRYAIYPHSLYPHSLSSNPHKGSPHPQSTKPFNSTNAHPGIPNSS